MGGDPWHHLLAVTRPALLLASTRILDDLRTGLAANGVREAVVRHETAPIFDCWMSLIGLQGISDTVAFGYAERHGIVTYAAVAADLKRRPECARLRSHWHFEGCGYRKGSATCAEPGLLASCPLPRPPLRKGSLNQAAFALFLFIRDVCGGDLVGWLDQRLAEADPGLEAPDRGARLRNAVLEPLTHVYGIGPKVWAMMLADLLLGADPDRERWVTAGAWMIAVDSLVAEGSCPCVPARGLRDAAIVREPRSHCLQGILQRQRLCRGIDLLRSALAEARLSG